MYVGLSQNKLQCVHGEGTRGSDGFISFWRGFTEVRVGQNTQSEQSAIVVSLNIINQTQCSFRRN